MDEPYPWFLGIDWGYHAHQLTVVDATGTRHGTRRVDHDAAAIADALAWGLATTQAGPAQIAVALETPRGALVSTLLARGFPEVYHLKGGILGYLEGVPEAESRWRGECFVFDDRVALGHGLRERPMTPHSEE